MTMAVEIPLGRVEDQHLELKSRDALKHPETIAREVVAMLNADGGEIWIGIREENGRAMEIEPVDDAEPAKERLWDHLVDSLEPALRHDEVRIELVDLPGGGEDKAQLLRVEVTPSGTRSLRIRARLGVAVPAPGRCTVATDDARGDSSRYPCRFVGDYGA